ncbi:MAG: dihydroorotate dehydrogenase, partial [Clostridia bacterium]
MTQDKMSVEIAGVTLKNPVITASGTFGFGREYSEFYDLSRLGAVCAKGLTLEPRLGNPPPRIAETPMGILNSVGLQNPGIHAFIRDEIPFLRKFDTKIIANISGNTLDEYVEMGRIIDGADVDMVELNISCPNV